jgi:hypothetical protein
LAKEGKNVLALFADIFWGKKRVVQFRFKSEISKHVFAKKNGYLNSSQKNT